jgi:hypothetical protein
MSALFATSNGVYANALRERIELLDELHDVNEENRRLTLLLADARTRLERRPLYAEIMDRLRDVIAENKRMRSADTRAQTACCPLCRFRRWLGV